MFSGAPKLELYIEIWGFAMVSVVWSSSETVSNQPQKTVVDGDELSIYLSVMSEKVRRRQYLCVLSVVVVFGTQPKRHECDEGLYIFGILSSI